MSAAKRNRIKATKPLDPVPYGVPQHTSEQQLRDAQAREWIGQYVAFDHDGKRVTGKCLNCRALPRMEPDEIPDFAVVVESMKTADKTVEVRLMRERCQFFENIESIKL